MVALLQFQFQRRGFYLRANESSNLRESEHGWEWAVARDAAPGDARILRAAGMDRRRGVR
jgi:hypothetical protein